MLLKLVLKRYSNTRIRTTYSAVVDYLDDNWKDEYDKQFILNTWQFWPDYIIIMYCYVLVVPKTPKSYLNASGNRSILRFRISSQKSITWSNYVVQIADTTTYYFDPTMSNGTLDDTVISVNIYVMSLLNVRVLSPEILRKLNNKTLFFNVTIRDLFYEG